MLGSTYVCMAEAPPNRFADNFDRLLGAHRLTARRAAQLLGVSPTTLSSWRRGKREPDASSLRRVAAFFEVDPFAVVSYPTEMFFMVHIANQDRFGSVEQRIAEGRAVDPADLASG
jgi:transcriptional regulator with XRE-family HTH domain